MGLQLIGMRTGPPGREHDALLMRGVRNTCREYMTRNTAEISVEEQLAWWASLQAVDDAEVREDTVRCYLFYLADTADIGEGILAPAPGTPDAVGYGLLRRSSAAWWLTGGLLPPYRGLGYGTDLFRYLTQRTPEDTFLEVRASNLAGLRTYEKLGFERVGVHGREDTVFVMVRRGSHHFEAVAR